jgi:hypothetical protein
MLRHAYREGRALSRASRRDDISREEKNVGRPTKKVLSAKEKKVKISKTAARKNITAFCLFLSFCSEGSFL